MSGVDEFRSEPSSLCLTCSAHLKDGAAFCSSCGVAVAPRFCENCGSSFDDLERFCSTCGAPRIPVQPIQAAAQVTANAAANIGSATKGLASLPWIALAMVGVLVLGGFVSGFARFGILEGVRFLLVAGVPLVLLAVVDVPGVTIDHRLAFSVGVGIIAASRGLTWLWDFLFGWSTIYQLTGIFALGGVLMVVTALPQLPPSTERWSSSASRYLLAPGVVMAVPLIWMGGSDSPYRWFGLSVADLLRGVLLTGVAVVASLLTRHLRQGLALALAFVGLADVLVVVHGIELGSVLRGVLVVGICAALVLLPDSISKASTTSSHPDLPSTAVPGMQTNAAPAAPAPRRSALELSGQVPSATDVDDGRAAGLGSGDSPDKDAPLDVPSAPHTPIDAPPPSGPRRD